MDKGKQIAEMVGRRFAAGEVVSAYPVELLGAIPQHRNGCSDSCAAYDDSDDIKLPPADTAPVAEAQNECEGSDCISYDFPMGFTGKGVRR